MLRILETFFGKPKIAQQFDETLSVKIGLHDRVRHRTTGEAGKVIQTATVKTSLAVIPSLTVQFENGQIGTLLPAEEFTKWTKYF